ncbi:hypothetical protein BS47DRAFT_1401377 [Hydnum rufescens UP504]|uniref:Ubiquitin-like protease family profile domain-containing protein n=1 Tax=Hydnum rufescens UP504 TaxID=1448309 RepID=A0A9P6AEJ2_9AGAM|nr:hypothetical protein BS47DRAFT_1401377 [Hydnum rufescens UP504]
MPFPNDMLSTAPLNLVAHPDFTRFPQRWNKHLPTYLTFIATRKHYVDALATFVGSVSTTAQRWYSHIQRNGFHVPVPLPSCEYPGANFRCHFEHHDTKARIMADVEIFLQHGYLCRGYAQWLMCKFVACLSRELGMPCPHFGVNDKLIGAVFRMEDLEDSRVSGVVRGLERDGVPMFAATILELWSETVWDRIPCLKTPWRNTTNVSPGRSTTSFLYQWSMQSPLIIHFLGSQAPAYGYPGFYYQYRDKKYYEEQAFLEALVVVDPQQESIPLLTKSYEVVAKFLARGPFSVLEILPSLSSRLRIPMRLVRWNQLGLTLLWTHYSPPWLLVQSMARRKYGQRPRPPHLPSEGGFIMFRDGTLVNDDAINSYIDVLKMFACPTVHVFNTFFFSRLLDGFDKVATWHKDLRHPVFTHMERIIVPIHLKSQSHWATVSIDFKRRIIMRKYLADLAALETCSFDLEAWTFIGSKDTSPQQTGTVDCGVFLIANIRNCAGIQPWKVLRPTEVPSARLQFMVDVVWGVIDYPRGYDHALQSIFPSHSPPAFILPDEPDYVHVPRPALPRPVPKIRSWGDITENEGRDLIRNAAAGDVASYQRIMVVLDHHVRVKNKDATPLARAFPYADDFRSQPGDDRSLHRGEGGSHRNVRDRSCSPPIGSLRDAGLLPSDRSESVHAESSSHHGRLPVDAEEQSTMEMNFAAISVDDVAMATASAPPMIAPPVIASPVVPPAIVPPIAPAAAIIPCVAVAPPIIAPAAAVVPSPIIVDGSEGQNALPYEQETLEEFRSMGTLATSRSRVNKKRSKKQGRIVYRMSIYFKDYMLAQEVLESTQARAKAQNYLGAMDLYYASVVYDRVRSSEERDALLAVAPCIHINSAQMGPQFLEHDLYPIPPQLVSHSPHKMAACSFTMQDFELHIALQEQSEGSHSVSLMLSMVYDVASCLLGKKAWDICEQTLSLTCDSSQ